MNGASAMLDGTIELLKQQLISDIQQLSVATKSGVEQRAQNRLLAVAHHAPPIMVMLAEPWLQTPNPTEKTLHILRYAARIHLYARILDDALDENLPIHRKNLLRVQPLFWESTQALARYNTPETAQASTQLIRETILAVEADDLKKTPDQWGAKNHHLLLFPLLLSDNSTAYQHCKIGLSTMIALLQAGDEWRQGDTLEPSVKQALLPWLSDSLNEQILQNLYQNGWVMAAQRMTWNARQLMNILSN